LLEQRKIKEAIECLRNELAPLNQDRDQDKLHKLSSFVICKDPNDLHKKANWDGAKGKSRNKLLINLQDYISPSLLIPENRLLTIIDQAIQLQKLRCLYHNTQNETISLFADHTCQPEQIPRTTKQILEHHTDEVWFVQFSHNGRYLASASKDLTVAIWDVSIDKICKPMQILSGHTKEVSYLVWSPDDTMLLTCANDNIKLWDIASGGCIRSFSKHTKAVTSCAWFPDGKHFVTGSLDKNIFLLDLEGKEIRKWEGARINDLAVSSDAKFMVAACMDKKIHIYNLLDNTVEYIQEHYAITSISLSKDNKFLLANIQSQEIHLWNLENRRLISQYVGQQQGHYVIRSCFGGFNESFILSGSIDQHVYIWHRQSGEQIAVLRGHTGNVNSVTWNPANHHMFASASDDHTIRIWA